MTRRFGTWMFAALCAAMGWVVLIDSTFGQTTNIGTQTAGVDVDPSGVLKYKTFDPIDGKLAKKLAAEAKAKLPADLARTSDLRKVSLNRLEAAVAELIAAGKPIPTEMKHLAGITRVANVFFYPETGDIVLAGPAEPFAADLAGCVIGLDTGAAVLELQDLVVAMRAFPATSGKTAKIYCSIDPTQEGLANLQAVLSDRSFNPDVLGIDTVKDRMKNAVGLQQVTVGGVSPATHFAQVLVEADYRMKLIGIGSEKPHKDVKLKSWVDRAKGGSKNAMQRWWFVPNYECVKATVDGNAMELVGQGVKLIGEAEHVGADGARKNTGEQHGPSAEFAANFTRVYPELAKRTPIYAQLKNVIDLSIAAAFIQEQGWYAKSGWSAEVFTDEDRFPVETYHTPKQVATACNAIQKGAKWLTPIGGGVEISPTNALQSDNLLKDDQGTVAKKAASIKVDGLEKNQWWWD